MWKILQDALPLGAALGIRSQSTLSWFSFSNISRVGGKQYNTFLSIQQDPKTQNWLFTNGNTYIGYWPGELLPYLEDGAEQVRYGGFTNAQTKKLAALRYS
ncbi:unnamed protein product [Brassica rapa]|uniref:Neprosin PEP catalytic domain-containing protein n=1 Tax=Brassica campestris TaxID=3711 RepID=A0A3P6AAU6_BRACM|nr:unnamed protein product [Brassica rapa]VDC90896.1 unnamed protein product [Brassica rapa]